MIRRIRMSARFHRLVFTEHAYEKMDQLGETEESVSAAIEGARSFVEQEGSTWRIFGGGLTCVVSIRGGVVVVTLFA